MEPGAGHLPVPAQEKAAGVKNDEKNARLSSSTTWGGFGREYHDARVREQLKKWDGKKRLANCGKHWIAPQPKKGRANQMGWAGSPPKFIRRGDNKDGAFSATSTTTTTLTLRGAQEGSPGQ